MLATLANDPVLARFRRALDEMYGNQLDRVVLFGSRARGDARPDSDYDVAVFLKSLPDRWAELDRLIGAIAARHHQRHVAGGMQEQMVQRRVGAA